MPAILAEPFFWPFWLLLAIAVVSGLMLLTRPTLRRNVDVRAVFVAATIGTGLVGGILLAGFYLLSIFFSD
jgi:hypothetical protein